MNKDVLIEIGLEELPARFVDAAEKQLREKTVKWLDESRITFQSVESFSTPRRLSVIIRNIAAEQTTIEEEMRGPQMNVAKNEAGEWTKAAIGFSKGQGKSVDDLVEKEVDGKTYVFVTKKTEGKPTNELLPEMKEIIESIQFANNMRWGAQTIRYARPIRWLVALYGEDIIPFEIAEVETNRISYGHRDLGGEISIPHAGAYESLLKENYVIADPKEREELILEGIRAIEEARDCIVPIDEELLAEVRNLVEYPTVFVGVYDERFLKLPEEVLIISMKEHQRYFPVKSRTGELLPNFIGVRNGDDFALDNVARGNEKVLRARLQDAEFFYEEDQRNGIDFYLEKLERVVFQDKLGTLADKVRRVKEIAEKLAETLKLSNQEKQQVIRAAELSKFDLTTEMVNEFTELQGVIGEIYAVNFNEDVEVAQAIREQYLPKQANGDLPASKIGAIVSIAEKMDTIFGIISVGLMPTGSQDPYGLRRQAIGVLRILRDQAWEIDLEHILKITETVYENVALEKSDHFSNDIVNFFEQRLAYLMKELDIEQDVIQAVTVKAIGNIHYLVDKAQLLSEKRQDETFKEKEEALVRVLNLSEKAAEINIQPELFETDSERELYKKYVHSKQEFTRENDNQNAKKTFEKLENLAEPIHRFFDNNMVMADDEAIRNNRLSLVKAIADLIKSYADLSLIEWKQHF